MGHQRNLLGNIFNKAVHGSGGVSVDVGKNVRIGVGVDSRGNVGVHVGSGRGGYGSHGGGPWQRGQHTGVFNRAAGREDQREIQSAYAVERRTLQEIQNTDRQELRDWHKQELDQATRELEQQGLNRNDIRRALIPLRHDQNQEQAQMRLAHQRQNEALTEICQDGKRGFMSPQAAIDEMHDLVERIYNDSGAVPEVGTDTNVHVRVNVGGLEF